MTRFFYDCEFIDDGRTIDLVSIGLVREDGAEYYAVSYEFDLGKMQVNKWLVDNVWPHLPITDTLDGRYFGRLDLNHPHVKPRDQIASEVRDFLLSNGDPELWAWYAAYDHVCLAQLFGRMIDLPDGVPMWTNDLKQEHARLERLLGREIRLPDQPDGEHNALADARHNLLRARHLARYERFAVLSGEYSYSDAGMET